MTLHQPLPWAGEFLYINSASQKLCTYLQIGQTFSSKQKNSSQLYKQLQKTDTKPRILGECCFLTLLLHTNNPNIFQQAIQIFPSSTSVHIL